jgi:tape measure domain-containing protein
MIQGSSSIWYQLGIDNSGLRTGADEARRLFGRIGDSAESESSRIDAAFGRIASAAAMIFGGISAASFIKEIVSVRGEFQKLEIAFETMLGSKERATALMNQMVDTAARTPFDLQSVSSGAKQLLAYGTAAEDVNDTLIRLGNIAAGLTIPLGDLVYLYGTTMVQGRLFTQDVRQFTGRGIPLVQELAKSMGKTTKEINEMVTAGKIGFAEVEKVIASLTNEGGKFYNLMEKQSASLTGQISNLEDAWATLMNNIGKQTEGFFSGAISVAADLVENYQTVGKVLAGIVATYGAYKAAIIALTVAQGVHLQIVAASIAAGRALTTAQAFQAVVMMNLTRVWRVFNKTMLANPIVAIVTAIVAASAALWALHDSTTAQERAQKRLNDLLEEGKQKKQDLQGETSSLIGVINSETESILEQIRAYEKLQGLYPETLRNLDLQQFKAMGLTSQTKLLNEELDKVTLSNWEKDRDETLDRISKLQLRIKAIRKRGDGNSWASNMAVKSILNDITEEEEYLMGVMVNVEKEYARIGKAQEIAATPPPVTKNKEYWAGVKKEAETALESLDADIKKQLDAGVRSGIDESVISSYNEAVKNLEEAKLKLVAYDTKKQDNSQKESQERILSQVDEFAKELADKLKSAQLDARQVEIDAMKEGTVKSVAQIKLDYDKQLQAIEEEQRKALEKVEKLKKDWIASGKSPDTFVSPVGDITAAYDQQKDNVTQDRDQKLNRFYDDLLEKYRSYEQQKTAILKRFEEERKAIEDSNASAEDKSSAVIELEKEQRKELKALGDAELNELQKDSDLMIRIFSEASEMSKSRLKTVITETRRLVSYLNGVSDSLPDGISPEMVEKLKQSPTEIKALYDQLSTLQDEYDRKTNYPFANFIKGLEKVKESSKLAASAMQETDTKKKKLLEDKADVAKQKGFQYLVDGATEATDAVSMLASKMLELAEVSGDGKLKESAEQMNAMAQNFSSAAKGAQSGGWIGAIVGGVTDMITQTVDSFLTKEAEAREFEQNRLDFLRSYELALLRVKDEDFTSVFGEQSLSRAAKAAELAREAMKKYADEVAKVSAPEIKKEFDNIAATVFGLGTSGFEWLGLRKSISNETKTLLKAYKDGYTDLEAMAVKTTDHSGWANFWGVKDKYTSLKDLAPELFEGGEFNVENAKIFLETNTQINDEQRKHIQGVIELREAYDENMKIIRDDISSTFGNLGDAAMDALVEAIKTGANAWDVFEDAGSLALENLGKKIAYELFFAKRFEDMQRELEETYSLGDPEKIGEKQMEILDRYFSYLEGDMVSAQPWMERFGELAKKRGFDNVFSQDAERKGLSQGITSVNQDSFNDYLGKITNIQDHTYHIRWDISSLVEQNRALASNSSAILENLTWIRSNTDHLANMQRDMMLARGDIADISATMKTIRDRGLTMN